MNKSALGWCLEGPDGRLYAETFAPLRRHVIDDYTWGKLLRRYEPFHSSSAAAWKRAQRDGWRIVRVRLVEVPR